MAPAHAQATRTWVSGVGDDANPCSRTAPCKTFAGAISKTAAKGEINVLDPGGFGGVTITKSISIIAEGVEGGVLVSGTNGIIVNAGASDVVVLQGLDIEGLGTGLHGVHITGNSGNVVIRKSTIKNFTLNAVNNVSNGGQVTVLDSYLKNNGGGVGVLGAGGSLASAFVINNVLDSHVNFAVGIGGPGNIVIAGNSMIGFGPKLAISGGGTITSYGNNVIRGATAAPSNTMPLQ
ncbi:MAG: hypothetical protein ABIR26_12080 [Ramlibacter sp.]